MAIVSWRLNKESQQSIGCNMVMGKCNPGCVCVALHCYWFSGSSRIQIRPDAHAALPLFVCVGDNGIGGSMEVAQARDTERRVN
jgi:hypothetical protein